MYLDNDWKFVAVLNRRHSLPVLMNALGHLATGLATLLRPGAGDFIQYDCPGGGFASSISRYPFIVLRSDNSSQLRNVQVGANGAGLVCNVFVTAMIGDSAESQVEATRSSSEAQLDYIAVALFGKVDEIGPLTKKFSLFKT